MDITSPSSQYEAMVSDSCSSSCCFPGNNVPRHSDAEFGNTRDVLQQMRHLEGTTYKRPLARQLPEPFNGLWRQQIVEWMYTLVKYCKLRHESAAAASYYLDVAVCKGLIHSPDDYQLGAMTALYLALKVYDSPCLRVVKLGSLVKLGNGEFTEDDILRMEQDLVTLLGWRLNPPTANCFLQQYLTLLPHQFHGEQEDDEDNNNSSHHVRDCIQDIALGAIEQVTARDYFLSVPLSVVGYSAMLFAIETLDLQYQQHQHQQMHHHPQQMHHHHLSSISSSLPPPPPHLTFLEFQTFLLHMRQVADLDSTSNPTVMRSSVLLDRTMKGLPIPASYINEGEYFFFSSSLEEQQQQQPTSNAQQQQQILHKHRPQDMSTSTIGDVQFVDDAATAAALATVGYDDTHSPNQVVIHHG
ncbi:cyclin-like protein [Nitzschia inconspicua]|uniref:Cyclin-like protein n=1 Tax=Nitzschia inconspicua TaxID=303405 RepID=A0A9K3LJA3_9STRA|nr:cyclin-like protein [Nitzschia inconspicua]